MSAAKKINVVSIPNYMDARVRAYKGTKPKQPTPLQVHVARGELLEQAFADGMQRVVDVADALDEIERAVGRRLDRFAVLLERYRAQVKRSK